MSRIPGKGSKAKTPPGEAGLSFRSGAMGISALQRCVSPQAKRFKGAAQVPTPRKEPSVK
jgi:hypothetical protein